MGNNRLLKGFPIFGIGFSGIDSKNRSVFEFLAHLRLRKPCTLQNSSIDKRHDIKRVILSSQICQRYRRQPVRPDRIGQRYFAVAQHLSDAMPELLLQLRQRTAFYPIFPGYTVKRRGQIKHKYQPRTAIRMQRRPSERVGMADRLFFLIPHQPVPRRTHAACMAV